MIKRILRYFWKPTWEEALLMSLQNLRLHPGEAEDARIRCIDILNKRLSTFYDDYKREEYKIPQWEATVVNECLELEEITPWEDKQHNERLRIEAQELWDGDNGYLFEQIKTYNDQWH